MIQLYPIPNNTDTNNYNIIEDGIFEDAPTTSKREKSFQNYSTDENDIYADADDCCYLEELMVQGDASKRDEDIFADPPIDNFDDASINEVINQTDYFLEDNIFADAPESQSTVENCFIEDDSLKDNFSDDTLPLQYVCKNFPMTKQSIFKNFSPAANCENSESMTFMDIPLVGFGVEMEMIIPQDSKHEYSYKSLAEALSDCGHKVEFVEGRCRHETRQHWKLVTDSSVKGKGMGYELVSPILRGEEGIKAIRRMYHEAKWRGSFVNDTCGFHVHIDAQQKSLYDLREIGYSYVALEDAFDRLVEGSRRGNINAFCQSNIYILYHSRTGPLSKNQLWEKFQEIQSEQQLVEFVNTSSNGKVCNRYRKINFTNVINPHKPSTIEFRQHAGVNNIEEAEAWIRLLLLFCEKSVIERLKVDNAQDEWNHLFDLVGCEKLREFYKKSRPTNPTSAWTCEKCCRTFQDVKALVQHQVSKKHFVCSNCGEVFPDWSALNQHMSADGHGFY